jgi:hypothetical protein
MVGVSKVRARSTMNGIHDMGAWNMGPIVYEEDRPFHEAWEGRVWALAALPLVPPAETFRYDTKSCRPHSICV